MGTAVLRDRVVPSICTIPKVLPLLMQYRSRIPFYILIRIHFEMAAIHGLSIHLCVRLLCAKSSGRNFFRLLSEMVIFRVRTWLDAVIYMHVR